MLFSHGCSLDINVLAIFSVKIHWTGPFTKIMRSEVVIHYFSLHNLNADYTFQQIKHCYIPCWLCTILVKFNKKTIVEKHLFIEGNNLKIVKSYLEAKPMHDQNIISPHHINTTPSRQVMLWLLVDPKPNSLSLHHMNCVAES